MGWVTSQEGPITPQDLQIHLYTPLINWQPWPCDWHQTEQTQGPVPSGPRAKNKPLKINDQLGLNALGITMLYKMLSIMRTIWHQNRIKKP